MNRHHRDRVLQTHHKRHRAPLAFASSTPASLPPKVGEIATTANFIPGSLVWSNFAAPPFLPSMSRRRYGVDQLEFSRRFQRDLLGGLRRCVDELAVGELATAGRATPARRAAGVESTFHCQAAAFTSMTRAVAARANASDPRRADGRRTARNLDADQGFA
ncbi:MAG: hypothetical protein U1E63_03935 [Burkholderiales bacterium]